VRYSQFFEWQPGISFYSNRGTAGIDGCTSTALGMANDTDKILTLITGDVGFLYDTNALWNQYLKSNFKIILINNGGGNIFSLIPGPDATGLVEKYFRTHMGVNIQKLSDAFGLAYFNATNEVELSQSLQNLYAAPKAALLEIITETEQNIKVWKEYFSSLKM
jgi:2-succinyl-5-enolpyruvyl-6-hydroxy-3-cyclohexene-1-carboxylate synthase